MRNLLFIVALLVVATLSIFVGVADITPADILSWDADKMDLILISRIPRTMALILAGIGMSVSGVIMQ